MPDTELPGYEQLVIPLPEEPTYALEPEGSLVATLVRRNAPTGRRAVLYLHGWNDYFFQAHLADEMAGQGYDLAALVHEQSISTNTAAAGGNAQLMTMA